MRIPGTHQLAVHDKARAGCLVCKREQVDGWLSLLRVVALVHLTRSLFPHFDRLESTSASTASARRTSARLRSLSRHSSPRT